MNRITHIITHIHKWFPAAVIGLLFLTMFGGVLFGGVFWPQRMFAFRDVAHFYYPLYRYVHEQLAAGQVPLWMPYENIGMPLHASGTAGVFYPGKLAFWLPLGYATCFKLFVTAHVLLAAGGAYLLAKRWIGKEQCSACCFAAIAYAFGAPILFQYCNVVMLIGAAWLPIAVLLIDRLLCRRRWLDAVLAAVPLAMMVLGGDPQTVYHVVLLSGLLWLIYRRAESHQKKSDAATEGKPQEGVKRKPVPRALLLGLMCVAALLLSAVQILPSYEFSRLSQRAVYDSPRNVYEYLGADPQQRSLDGLLRRHVSTWSHERFVFDFSVGPWRYGELLWPNSSGRQFPVNSRWISAVPDEQRVWTPSLYVGLLTVLLALSAMRFRLQSRSPELGVDGRHRNVARCWLTWCVILAIIAALGRFGPVWLIERVYQWTTGDQQRLTGIGDPVGGLYWLLTVTLPGYVNFRYPAKWLTFAALGLAILSGGGLAACFGQASNEAVIVARKRLGRITVVFLGISIVLLLAALCTGPFWGDWLSGVRSDNMFGPLEANLAWRDLIMGLLQSTVIAGLLLWLMRSTSIKRPHASAAVLLVVLAIDLALANRWMIATVPQKLFEVQQTAVQAIQTQTEADRMEPDDSPIHVAPTRLFRHPIWYPTSWREQSSPDRLATTVLWDRETLWPKYTLEPRLAVTEVHGTMMPVDYLVYVRLVRMLAWRDRRAPSHAELDLMAAGYSLLPRGRNTDQAIPLATILEGAALDDSQHWENPQGDRHATVLWRMDDPMPRAWIVHNAASVEPIPESDRSWSAQRDQCIKTLWPDKQLLDIRSRAVVETNDTETLWQIESLHEPTTEEMADLPRETCRITSYEPEQIEIETALSAPGMLVLADQFASGWQASVYTEADTRSGATAEFRKVPIIRTNRFMRGILLPQGRHRVMFFYRPESYRIGLQLSFAAWIALVGLVCLLAARNMPPRGSTHLHSPTD